MDAPQCAADAQIGAEVRQSNEPEDRKLLFRIGTDFGNVIVKEDDIHGDGVNIAARLEELAEPDGICVSHMVYTGVRNKVSLDFADPADRSLKNIADPVHVFQVILKSSIDRGAAVSIAIFRRPAVAVLLIQNLSGDPEREFFVDGLIEDIIISLSLWKSFPVITRNSTFAFKGQSPDVRKVGKELGARYVIEGSVRKAGDRNLPLIARAQRFRCATRASTGTRSISSRSRPTLGSVQR